MKTKLYILARQLHRILMFSTSFLLIFMGGTGIILKYPGFFGPLVDLNLMRVIHSNLSPLFAISVFIMMISGIYMYIYPLLAKKIQNRQANANPINQNKSAL